MEILKSFQKSEFAKKIGAILLILLLIYALQPIFNIVLLTFIFTYLIYSVQTGIMNSSKKIVNINEKFISIVLYSIIFLIISLTMYKYVPIIMNQIISIISLISEVDLSEYDSNIVKILLPLLKELDVKEYLHKGSDQIFLIAKNLGKFSINIFISLVLSLFFMLEQQEIKEFLDKFNESRIGGIYKYMKGFGNNFLNSFAKVMQAQIFIAFCNALLSAICLYFMGFSQILGLGVMIFILGLVPVAGVILSLIPLSIIAFKIGGIMKILSVLIMIVVLHAIEAYILNPKFMSVKTKLPVFFTFGILVASEHLMGTWGLLLGIPLFIFILDLLNVNLQSKKRR